MNGREDNDKASHLGILKGTMLTRLVCLVAAYVLAGNIPLPAELEAVVVLISLDELLTQGVAVIYPAFLTGFDKKIFVSMSLKAMILPGSTPNWPSYLFSLQAFLDETGDSVLA